MKYSIENIPIVNSTTNFWLVRTQKGFFYDQFISESYIALGWNKIDEEILPINISRQQKEDLKDFIKDEYKDEKRPGSVINKCINFMHTIKEGDIIVIPGRKNSSISFAIAGEYYEVEDKTHIEEFEALEQIKAGFNEHIYIECPYKKRRKIKIIRTIKSDEYVNPNIYKAIMSIHGISNISESADIILSSIYEVYYYDNKLTTVFRVRKEGRIDPLDITGFVYNFSCALKENSNYKLGTKINVSSPGDAIIEIFNTGKQVYEFIADNWMIFVGAWLMLTGGEGFGFKFNSPVDLITTMSESRSKIKTERIDRKIKKVELKNKKLDLKNKTRLYNRAQRQEMLERLENVKGYLVNMKKAAKGLEIDSSKIEKVIDLERYRTKTK